jgi:type I restriction enzyme S subunit
MLIEYKNYKKITEFWLPLIPDNWENTKIKHIFKERVEKGYPDKPLLAATQNMGVVPKNVYGNRTVEASKDFHLLKLVKTGDFVISLRSFQGGIEYAYYEGIISPAYTVMIQDKNNSHFFRYLFKSIRFIELLQNCVTGIREGQNIDYSKLREHLIPIPPRPEQDQIVRYLDWKVSMINKYINAKKKQIELLKERKQAIINQAIIKGLDMKVRMKDSGIEWLGKIPAHWEVKKLKRCSFMKSGVNLTSYEIENEGKYPVYGGNGLRGFFKIFNRSGDFLLIGRQGALCGNVHKISGDFWATEHAIVVEPKKLIDINWYYYMLMLMNLNKYSESAAQPGISVEKIENLKTCIPPLFEQREIVEYLYEKVKKIDLIVKNNECKISYMQEYRTRLISDVVTGKVNVQNVKVPEFIEDNQEGQEITELNQIQEETKCQ